MLRFWKLPCVVLALFVVLDGGVAVAQRKARPNVVLIMADDVGYECFGSYGSKQYKTPRLDAMARQGVRFEHCYSQPLCTPSRIKLMTGRSNVYNYSAFSVLNRGLKTIGHHFQDADYRTFVAGKWQLYGARHYSKQFRAKGTLPSQAGFDECCLWQVDELGGRYWKPLLYINGKNKQFGGDAYGPKIVTDAIIDFMKKGKAKPFFVYYPMILVHSPFPRTPDSEPLKKGISKKEKNQRYFEDMVAYMDKTIGRIVDATKELGIHDNTLFLFVGDNGTHKMLRSQLNGKSIQGGKGLMTDAGTRVSMIAYGPGLIKQGLVCQDLVDFSDLLPTCLDAVGAPVPAGLDGRSFVPQLRGEKGVPREWIFCYYCPRPERTPPQRFVRDHRWKLYGDGRFFDVSKDVLENNVISDWKNDPAAAKAHAKLAKALRSMPSKGKSLLNYGN